MEARSKALLDRQRQLIARIAQMEAVERDPQQPFRHRLAAAQGIGVLTSVLYAEMPWCQWEQPGIMFEISGALGREPMQTEEPGPPGEATGIVRE